MPGEIVPQAEIDRMPGLGSVLAMGWIEELEEESPATPPTVPAPDPVPASAASSSSVPDGPPPGVSEADPALANPCPHCGVDAGAECETSAGNATSPHKARG